MKHTLKYGALALALLPQVLISGSAVAAGPGRCPVFNAAMVDAAALVSVLYLVDPPASISDDPSIPALICRFDTMNGDFHVNVNLSPSPAEAFVEASNSLNTDHETIVFATEDGLTDGELHACRAQVIQTLVWNQHCAPFLP